MSGSDLARVFQERHAVSAIVCGGGVCVAVVDGLWVQVGQLVDGCRLVDFRGDTVVFDCEGRPVTLSVEAARLSDGSNPDLAGTD
jgi:hypothetical protein